MSADRTGRLSCDRDFENQLSRLPPLEPRRDVFPRILEATRRRPREGRQRRSRLIGLAAAAMLVLSLGVISLLAGRMDRQSRELAGWVEYSQQLESQLRAIAGRGRVMRGHRAAVAGELEGQVAAIDWQLAGRAANAGQIALWRQRAALLNDLVIVQAGELVFSDERIQRPVATINPPAAIPASFEL